MVVPTRLITTLDILEPTDDFILWFGNEVFG